jgi:PAS domain S-box-containing protein
MKSYSAENFAEITDAGLYSAIENLDYYVWTIDRQRNYISFNSRLSKAIKKIYGVSINPGDKVYGMLEPVDPAGLRVWEKLYEKGFNGETQRLIQSFCVSGTKIFLRITISPIRNNENEITGLFCLAKDITKNKLKSIEIRRSEAFYRYLFEKSPLPKWICDQKTLRYLEVNDMAVTKYGYSREEFLNMTAFDLRNPEDQKELAEIINLETPEEYNNGMVRHILKNGELIYAEIAAHPVNYKNVPAYLVVAHDISKTLSLQRELVEERMHKEMEMERIAMNAREIERENLGMELHDTVNPMLATAKLYIETFKSDTTRYKDLADKSTTIINDSILEIRKISQSLVKPSLGPLTLKEAITDLADTLQLNNKKVSIKFCGLNEEKFRISQELVNNIMKYSQASKVQMSILQDDEWLIFKVKDNGVGFEAEKKRNGIGLNNIIHRAKSFNGEASIITSPGKGCTVALSFPIGQH